MNRLKSLLTSLAIAVGVMAPVLAPASVYAQRSIEEGLCAGANLNVSGSGSACDGTEASDRVDGILKTVIDIFSLVVGVISVIMIIIGGLKYITSGGDSGNVTGAKNTILYAVIGLVVVALAQVIVKFVLKKASE
jgi:cytochrome bd-type quinol oxidase subunit 2